MSYTLQLVQGSTTIDLNDGTNTKTASDYTPAAEDIDNPTVSETLTVVCLGANQAAVMATRSTIVDMLRRGRDRQRNRVNPRVFIVFQPDGAAAAWRSELLDYRIANSGELYDLEWPNSAAKLVITWTRRNAWEANTETYLTLTNDNGSTAAGLTVYNCNDGAGSSPTKQVNYAAISGASIAGDLPANCRVEITNLSTEQLRQVWIGQNWINPANVQQIYEGEDGHVYIGFGTVVSGYPGESGGKHQKITLSIANQLDTLTYWTLTSDQISYWAGSWAHILLRFGLPQNQSMIQGARFKFTLEYSGSTLYDSGLIAHDTGFRVLDLGGVRIPPWIPSQTNLSSLTLKLWVYTLYAGDYILDYAQLLPADGFRYLNTSGFGLPQASRIVDDGILGELYADAGDGTSKIGVFAAEGGSPIRLYPGKDQRLYFNSNDSANTGDIVSMSVRVAYRARRLML